jgi:predicted CoA-binding protein
LLTLRVGILTQSRRGESSLRSDELEAPMQDDSKIADFLAGGPHAVVGASRDRAKIGNQVLRAYIAAGRPVLAVNPTSDIVEGLKSYPDLASLPVPVYGVSVITPPHVTESIVEQAAALGIKRLWLQPGAESEQALRRAAELGISVISGGPCILVVFADK